MPLLETIGLVAALISAFVAIATEYRGWRQRHNRRITEAQNIALQASLDTSGPIVQAHYNDHFRQLGQVFAKGDGKSYGTVDLANISC